MKRAVHAILVLALGLFLATPSVALGQNKGNEQPKVKTYDFSGDDVQGDLLKPDGESIDARAFASHTSLIRIRTDFIREILKSAEDL